MHSILKILIVLLFPIMLFGQNKFIDSIQNKLNVVSTDTGRVEAFSDLCFYYRYVNTDSAIYFGNKAYELSLKIKFQRGQALALNDLGLAYREYGDLSKALELELKSMKICNENKFLYERGICYRRIGLIYLDLNDFDLARDNHLKAIQDHLIDNNKRQLGFDYQNLGIIYLGRNQTDSSRFFLNKSIELQRYCIDLNPDLYGVVIKLEHSLGNNEKAFLAFKEGIKWANEFSDYRNLCNLNLEAAKIYFDQKKYDSAELFANASLSFGLKINNKKSKYLIYSFLYTLYDGRNAQKALTYLKLANTAKDSLFGAGNIQLVQKLVARENQRQIEIQNEKTAFQTRAKIYGLIGGLLILMTVLFYFFRNNIRQKQVNSLLKKQKTEIEETLHKLKETQTQLIQSEKMASLGELTAGIAHEIQNPLNFVNNFSEVSAELVDEMKSEIKKGNYDEVNVIADDIKQNLEKINHHGQRAADIVKGMLQHSRSSSGVKEPTDINALADEYLRLAYHGLRAKDKSFNATMKTDFDKTIGNINIIPQDIGRVILNLITNAFYAVNEKSKQGIADYEPTVTVSTKRVNNQVEIRVADNGNGIPLNILDKIFQPFFTTKPTGQGTGLGLSLSYDIVKANGGELKVETNEARPDEPFGRGEGLSAEQAGSVFTILLPIV
jgi:two-component system, NtrC family, sensor kinase